MKKTLLLSTSLLFLVPQILFAQPGSLDASFGTGGKVLNNYGFQNFSISSKAIQADGKIIVAGETSEPGTSNVFLVRFNTNGTLDNTFDGDGIVLTDVNSGSDDFAAKVIALSNGTILLGGYYNTLGSFTDIPYIFRYASNGSLDNTFDGDGKLFLPVNDFSLVVDMLVQSDGKIILVGDLGNDFGLIRVTAAGAFDNTFGTNGVAAFDFGVDTYSSQAAALQADGKIVVTGTVELSGGGGTEFATARYNTNGTIDNSFGTAGLVVTDVGSSDDTPFSITVLSSGSIIVAGEGTDQGGFADGIVYGSVVRYTSSGALDNTFNSNGIRTINTSGNYIFFGGHIVQTDGKIVLSGTFKNASGNYDFAAARLNTNGTSDASFDGDGFAVLSASPNEEAGLEILLQGDGKLVLAGYSSNAGRFSVSTARFNTGGSIDLTYDTDGFASTIIGGTPGTVDRGSAGVACIAESNGKITTAGAYHNGAFNSVILTRCNANGTPDNTFGSSGVARYILTFEAQVSGAVLQPDGKILVAASFFEFAGGAKLAILRFNSNGTIDNTFASGGKLVFEVTTGNAERLSSILLQPDGKILVSGVSIDFSIFSGSVFIRRYNANGTIDNTFGTSGTVVPAGFDFLFELSDAFSTTQKMALQPDGKIIFLGTSDDFADPNFAIRRFNSNGTPDGSFNSGNLLTVDFGDEDGGFAVTLQPDGKMLVSGYSFTGSARKVAVARITTGGTLDNSFDTDGKVTVAAGDQTLSNCISVQADGRIVVGGINTTQPAGNSYITVIRLLSTGALDNSFGTGGSVFLDQPLVRIDNPNSLVLQSDGKILLTGSNQNNYALIRLNNNFPTSVRDVNSPLFKMKFTPNPFADALLLSATDIPNGKYDMRILNSDGKVLAVKSFNVTGRQIQLPVLAKDWPKGVILIEIVSNNDRKTFTLIRQ